MSDEEEDMGAMAWPGFVDILSSVIIMFVFFVMVVASALYFHIIIFKSKILSQVNLAQSASVSGTKMSSSDRFMSQDVEDLDDTKKLLDKPTEENNIVLYQEHTQFEESENQEIKVLEDEDAYVIFFGGDAISVTQEVQNQVISMIKAKGLSQNAKVKIVAGKNPEAANDVISRQIAVSRMLNVRNVMIDSNLNMQNVTPSVSGHTEIDDTFNYVKIIFEGE